MAERRGNKGEILTQFDQLLPSRVPTWKTEGVHNPDFLASERLAVYSKSSIFCIIIIRSIIGLTVKLDKKKERGVIELRCSRYEYKSRKVQRRAWQRGYHRRSYERGEHVPPPMRAAYYDKSTVLFLKNR